MSYATFSDYDAEFAALRTVYAARDLIKDLPSYARWWDPEAKAWRVLSPPSRMQWRHQQRRGLRRLPGPGSYQS